jgi:hypothetical protein
MPNGRSCDIVPPRKRAGFISKPLAVTGSCDNHTSHGLCLSGE